jgi:hypothetical protein
VYLLKIVGLPSRQYMVPALPIRLPRETQQKCLFAEDKWGTTPYIASRNCRQPQSGRTSPLKPRQSATTVVFVLEKINNWVENCVVLGYYANCSGNFLNRFRTTYRSLLQGSRIHNNFFYHATSLHSCTNYHNPLPNHLHQPYWLAPQCSDYSPPTIFLI